MKPWTAIVFAAGDIGELRYQGPALRPDDGSDGGLLRLQSRSAEARLGGRDTMQRDGVTLRGHQLAVMRKLIPRPFVSGLSCRT